MGVDRKCIHMMQTEQADTVRYLGSNPFTARSAVCASG